MNFDFSRNINVSGNAIQAHERFGGVDFDRRNYNLSTFVSTSRLFSLGGSYRWGDEIYYIDRWNPYLGRGNSASLSATVRPDPRLTSQLDLVTSRFFDIRNGSREVFNVQILRALSTFAFTDRLLLRNIFFQSTALRRRWQARHARADLLPGHRQARQRHHELHDLQLARYPELGEDVLQVRADRAVAAPFSPDCQRPPRRCPAVQCDQSLSIRSCLDAVESQDFTSTAGIRRSRADVAGIVPAIGRPRSGRKSSRSGCRTQLPQP